MSTQEYPYNLYPMPTANDGDRVRLKFRIGKRWLINGCFSATPAHDCCGAYYLWHPCLTVQSVGAYSNGAEENYLVNALDYLPSGTIDKHFATTAKVRQYTSWCMANAVLASHFNRRNGGAFCTDGDRKEVDRLAESMVDMPFFFSNAMAKTGRSGGNSLCFGDDAERRVNEGAVVNELDFPSSHGSYRVRGYVLATETSCWRNTDAKSTKVRLPNWEDLQTKMSLQLRGGW
jgi:hypothetical protein